MPEQVHVYDELATREGFNRSLRHFKFISSVIGDFESKRNIADFLSECLAEKTIEPRQVLPTLNAILVDKYHYVAGSHNMTENFEDFDSLTQTVGTWRAVDVVVAYFHPELGVVVVNPKNRAHWDVVRVLKRNELLTIFVGAFAATPNEKLCREAMNLFVSLVEGVKVKTPAALTKGTFVFKKRAPVASPAPARAPKKARGRPPARAAAAPAIDYSAAAGSTSTLPSYTTASAAAAPAPSAALAAPAPAPAAPSGAPKRMTPMYAIPVTNELFHNGNVEAWKKIIQSYTTKYPGLEVYVFYEGERIHDINTLFKWGKVKHGSAIMIAVAGDDIRDVAKLQRYLKQGASHMFEAFLKAQVGAILNLF
ncbi:MAG TPA: hypothetical protein VHE79_05390 [Spirochaetia bacterium]